LARTEIYTLSLHDALPIWAERERAGRASIAPPAPADGLSGVAGLSGVGASVGVRVGHASGVSQLRTRLRVLDLTAHRDLQAANEVLLVRHRSVSGGLVNDQQRVLNLAEARVGVGDQAVAEVHRV